MRPFTVVSIIPTGVGAAVGGFAGDGTPATNLLAAACDRLITHPNAINGAAFYHASRNVLYVEGAALDAFCRGELALREVASNRIGLLLDAGIRAIVPDPLPDLWNAVESCRRVGGVAIPAIAWTDGPVGARVVLAPDGTSHGEVARPEAVLAGARALLAEGVEAIALACALEGAGARAVEAYQRGAAPDPIGGLEAILSHLVVTELGVPCAHAPVEAFPEVRQRVDPRAAAEELSPSYLPCVLFGLARAPRYVPRADAGPWDLTFDRVDAVVAPAGCLGGVSVLAAVARGLTVIAVENPTALAVTASSLGLPGVIPAGSYAEAAGLLLALRHGIAPGALA